ncbi:MarR family winged helix-turn-helix transcriptional regulator [Achromobacter aloeverae]|nr:MarR family winged helix-turn-helix transcriptional regulator [Achromobacter aloeverae]
MSAQHVERLSQLYSRPGFLLRRAHQIYVAIFEANFERLSLSPAQYSVMVALHDLHGVNQGDLAKAIGMNKVTVSQIVQALETRGWITRKKADDDRRQRQLTLTADGLRAVNQTAAMAEATYAEQMAPLSEPERQRLFKLLQRIVDELEPRARTPFEPVATGQPAPRGRASGTRSDRVLRKRTSRTEA